MLFQFLFRTTSYNSKFRRRKFADIRFMFCQFFKKDSHSGRAGKYDPVITLNSFHTLLQFLIF